MREKKSTHNIIFNVVLLFCSVVIEVLCTFAFHADVNAVLYCRTTIKQPSVCRGDFMRQKKKKLNLLCIFIQHFRGTAL